jgi:hypothetical protein
LTARPDNDSTDTNAHVLGLLLGLDAVSSGLPSRYPDRLPATDATPIHH